MEWVKDDYKISDDKSLLSINRICELLAKSYWAEKRSREKIGLSIKNSICIGVYFKDKQVGFARVVTDYSTMYWLCDVFIEEEYRGKGLGKELVKLIAESEELKDLYGILGTRDAHGLYEKFGFNKAENMMTRKAVKTM